MNKKTLGVLMLLIGVQTMQGLTPWQVVKRAAVVGLLSGTGAYCLVAKDSPSGIAWPFVVGGSEERPVYTFNQAMEKATSAGLAASAGIGVISGYIFDYWTAQSRCNWAYKEYAKLCDLSLYKVQMHPANINKILQDSGCESKELPLVEAFNRLRSYDKTLNRIRKELIKALNDTDNHSVVGRKLRNLSRQVDYDLTRVRANEAFIKNHDKTTWLEQWKIYQKQKLERERIQQQYATNMTTPQLHGHVVYHWH